MDTVGLAMVLVIPAVIAFVIFFGWGATILLLLLKRTRAFAFSISLSGIVSAGYCLVYSMLGSFAGLGPRPIVAGVPSQVFGSVGLALVLGFGTGASCAILVGLPFFLLSIALSKKRKSA